MARESAIKVVSFNIFAIGAVGVGLFLDVIQPVFINDKSDLSYIIALTTAFVVLLSLYDSFRPLDWVRSFIKFEQTNLYLYGLIGTLIGLSFLVTTMSTAVSMTGTINDDLIPRILMSFTAGLRTAFNPTLVGIVSWVWVRHIIYFTRYDQ